MIDCVLLEVFRVLDEIERTSTGGICPGVEGRRNGVVYGHQCCHRVLRAEDQGDGVLVSDRIRRGLGITKKNMPLSK